MMTTPGEEPAAMERVKAAIAAHEPEDGYLQWYADEHTIDCDAGEFWRVVAKALGDRAPDDR